MMRKVKKRSIITSLGAAAMLASLSVGGTAFAASTDQAKNYQTQLEEHKNLQAYTNPLTVQALTTTKGVLPDATSGISNWSQVPAGTVAAWDNKPEVNKAGTSYGTVYVTFPDGSRSRLAVYVTVKDGAASQSSENTNTTSSDKSSSAAGTSKSTAKSSQIEGEAKTSAKDADNHMEKSTTVEKTDKDQATKSSSRANEDVVVKDLGSTTVTEKNVSVVSNSKDKDKSSNPISVATRLPETVAKATNPFVIICGALIAAVSGAVIWSKKLKKRN